MASSQPHRIHLDATVALGPSLLDRVLRRRAFFCLHFINATRRRALRLALVHRAPDFFFDLEQPGKLCIYPAMLPYS